MAANGVAYAPPEARPGVVPRMLAEILGTRIMVLSVPCFIPPGFQIAFLQRSRSAFRLDPGAWKPLLRPTVLELLVVHKLVLCMHPGR